MPAERTRVRGHLMQPRQYIGFMNPDERTAYLEHELDLQPDLFTVFLATGGNGGQQPSCVAVAAGALRGSGPGHRDLRQEPRSLQSGRALADRASALSLLPRRLFRRGPPADAGERRDCHPRGHDLLREGLHFHCPDYLQRHRRGDAPGGADGEVLQPRRRRRGDEAGHRPGKSSSPTGWKLPPTTNSFGRIFSSSATRKIPRSSSPSWSTSRRKPRIRVTVRVRFRPGRATVRVSRSRRLRLAGRGARDSRTSRSPRAWPCRPCPGRPCRRRRR